jgi:hypothetical protein
MLDPAVFTMLQPLFPFSTGCNAQRRVLSWGPTSTSTSHLGCRDAIGRTNHSYNAYWGYMRPHSSPHFLPFSHSRICVDVATYTISFKSGKKRNTVKTTTSAGTKVCSMHMVFAKSNNIISMSSINHVNLSAKVITTCQKGKKEKSVSRPWKVTRLSRTFARRGLALSVVN